MNTVRLMTGNGEVELYEDLQHVLDDYNKDGKKYAIRVRAGQCELYHTECETVVGLLDEVTE